MQLVVPIAVRNAVSAATITFTASSMIHLHRQLDDPLLLHNLLLSFSSHRFHYFFVTQKFTDFFRPTDFFKVTQKFTEITEILRPPDYYKK